MSSIRDETYIFLDTCSLLESSWNRKGNSFVFDAQKDRRFWQTEMQSLMNAGSVILPVRNYEELIKHAHALDDPSRPHLRERSECVLTRIDELRDRGDITLVGDANDPFADAILLSVALKFRTTKNLLFLTQDRNLATDLITIASFKSVRPRRGHELKVRRLNREGIIEPWHLRSSTHKPSQPQGSQPARKSTDHTTFLERWWK
ncbi:MAG: hypothetical protein Q4B77_05255 [Coriobacteriaceae bacterium]|nr:hypothetical protein [Coriobacteriaceae bacterium]